VGLHQAHEYVEHNVDFRHIETVKCEQHVLVQQVRKSLERSILITQMNQQGASHIRHSLHVTQVSPKHREASQNILQWLMQNAPSTEVSQISKCSVQIYFHDLDVLFEGWVIIRVLLSDTIFDQQ